VVVDTAIWRLARATDDDAIAELCIALNREDPGPAPVPIEHMRATLAMLRREPSRGCAVALDAAGHVAGYALLIAFWSNELGGEVCEIDEIFVQPQHRGRGHARALLTAIERGELWAVPVVALALGVSPNNARARRLYEGLGFAPVGTVMVRRREIQI
jgi:ribosomal protein S18 acetylase RimI-like enzyme